MKNPDYDLAFKGAGSHSREHRYLDSANRQKALAKFLEYDEYLTIEIDTETQEARVVPVKELTNEA
jgi:hypothetical protein